MALISNSRYDFEDYLNSGSRWLAFLSNALPLSRHSTRHTRPPIIYSILKYSPYGLQQYLCKTPLQRFVNREYQRRTRRRPSDCDSTASIHPSQTLISPQLLAHRPERIPSACPCTAQVFRLHARFDRVGGVEDKVVGHTSKGPGSELLVYRQRGAVVDFNVFVRLGTYVPEHQTHGLKAAKPCRRPSSFTDQCA